MTKDNHNDRMLSDQLADFSNEVMKSKDPGKMSIPSQDKELRQLQETVVLMHKAAENREPSKAESTRMKTKIMDVWDQEIKASSQYSDQPSWWEKILRPQKTWRSPAKRQQVYTMRAAFAAVVILMVSAIFFQGTSGNLSAAAVDQSGLLPWIILAVAGIGLFGWWVYLKKK